MISIHRSLAGPDLFLSDLPCWQKFQSTGPLRDPTPENYSVWRPQIISIHRSLAGPDQRRYKRHQRDPISIHRSLAGPDNVVFVPSSAVAVFQSTGPLRDPTALNDGVYKKGEISIHRSLAGPDVLRLIYTASWGYFNPQVPCGTRPSEVLAPWVYDDFNPQVPCGTRPGRRTMS